MAKILGSRAKVKIIHLCSSVTCISCSLRHLGLCGLDVSGVSSSSELGLVGVAFEGGIGVDSKNVRKTDLGW